MRATRAGACCLAALLAFSPLPGACVEQPAALRVLFVGNSYVSTNDLPSRVRQLARQRGVAIDATLHAEPDRALSDHLRERDFDALLARHWDWIVLQQGPSSLPASRDELVASARVLAARLRGRPTRIALFAAWPAATHAANSPAAEASYRAAAAAIDACVLPVAAAWRLSREGGGSNALYQQDRLHPTRAGTRLSAMVVVRGLLGEDTNPSHDPGNDDARTMAVIVDAAIAQEPLACRPR